MSDNNKNKQKGNAQPLTQADLGLNFQLYPKQELLLSHPARTRGIPGYEVAGEVLFGGAKGGGKGQLRGAEIVTPYGIRKWEDLKVGDKVCDPFGKIQEIVIVHPWEHVECYRVSFNDGTSAVVSDNHLWNYWVTNSRTKSYLKNKDSFIEGSSDDLLGHTRVTTTKALKERFDRFESSTRVDKQGYPQKANIKIPITNPVTFTKSYRVPQVTISPYVLGVLLGDGVLGNTGSPNWVSIQEKEIGDLYEIYRYFEQDGMGSHFTYRYAVNGNPADNYIRATKGDTFITDELKRMGLYGTKSQEKFIPEPYKLASIEDRFALIQGLLDTDGYANPDKCSAELVSTSKQLAEDVAFVVRSLGGYASISEKPEPHYRDANGEKVICSPAWRVYITAPDLKPFFRLSRKKNAAQKRELQGRRFFGKVITNIESVGVQEMRCITVSGWHGLYITDGFTVTHNSYGLRIISIILALECPGVSIYLFRKTYVELTQGHILGPNGYRAILNSAIEKKLVRFDAANNVIMFRNGENGSFAGGSVIYLRHMQHEKNVHTYQGAEIHVLMIDEATHFSSFVYNYLRGGVRLGSWVPPEGWSGYFPRIMLATNPGGISHNMLRQMFVDFLDKDNPYKPKRAPAEEGGMLRQYIPATVYDNPILLREDPHYIDRIRGMGSPDIVRAMLEGSWDIVAGGMFDDVWNSDITVIQPFKIPDGWRINRGFDWGSSHPFACLWFAESDGKPFMFDPGVHGLQPVEVVVPKGTLFVIEELYGNDKSDSNPNTGLKITNMEIGALIRAKEDNSKFLLPVRHRITAGPADNQIFNEINKDSIVRGMNIGYHNSESMSKHNIFTRSDKSPGSRVKRWARVRDRLAAAIKSRQDIDFPEDSPALYFFPHCYDSIRTIPTLIRSLKDIEDLEEGQEDHLADVLGYRVLSPPAYFGTLETTVG